MGEAQVDNSIDQPAGQDDPAAADPVGKGAKGGGGEHLAEMEEGPEQGDMCRRHTQVGGPQKQKGVRGVAEGKEEDEEQVAAQLATGDEIDRTAVDLSGFGNILDLDDDQQDGGDAGHGGSPEYRAQVPGQPGQQDSG